MLCSSHYSLPGQDTSQCSMLTAWLEVQRWPLVMVDCKFQLYNSHFRFFQRGHFCIRFMALIKTAALQRDQCVTAQPISIRKAQSRKKSPRSFAHLMNFSKSFICVGNLIILCILNKQTFHTFLSVFRAMFKWSRRATCAKDHGLFNINYPQINKAKKSDHMGGSCTWSRATCGQSHTAEILSRSVEMPSLLNGEQGHTPLEQGRVRRVRSAAFCWIQFQSCRLKPLQNISAASTCHRKTSYGWLCHLDRWEGLLVPYHLTLAPWIYQRLPMH